jgi:FixJ family two-component response regulator
MKLTIERPGVVHVADDDARFRTAFGRALSAAGHAPRLYGSAAEYLAADDSEGPACLIVDLRMPGTNGLDLQEALARRGNSHPVIFLSAHGDVPSTVRAMRNGALDFLTKPIDEQRLIAVVRAALDRDRVVRERNAQRAGITARLATLTERERQVLSCVVVGKLNKQIAADLGTAEKTIKVHRARMMRKMEVNSLAELVQAWTVTQPPRD